MRTWHLTFAVFLAALAFAFAREEVGRVALVVFLTASAMVALGTTSVMLLFRTFGSLGTARRAGDYVEAVAATLGVLAFGASSMLAVLWCGISWVWMVVR